MSFNPKTEYTIVPEVFPIRDFFDYKGDYVVRPPYQRKSVWRKKKKQALMDSLFRRYYVPRLVIREVRLADDKTVHEIIDGQQRITAVQEFFDNEYKLPDTLRDVGEGLAGAYFKDLDVKTQRFAGKNLKYQADVIKDIDDPKNVAHQITATEIFWRLQQGESLNYMEIAHAQLSSLKRNFIVKYADDQTFDFAGYRPLNENPDKHNFFKLLDVSNKRMQHLQYMARFILIEEGDGFADLSNTKIEELVANSKKENGIGNYEFENDSNAQKILKTLNMFYEIFKDDPMLDSDSGIKELSVEYFVISIYLLIRHLAKYYVMDDSAKKIISQFVQNFHQRWKTYDESTDTDLLTFSNHRQQGMNELETRDSILRMIFFRYLQEQNCELIEKDTQRSFSEFDRIKIYRDGKGLCVACLEEGKPENEARVSWSKYHADHVIPHALGGKTKDENAQVLCAAHNLSKGARV